MKLLPSLLVLLGLASPAVAGSPYSSVFVFGDSLSDNGNIPGLLLSQDPTFPILFPVSPPYFDHRFSNGPTYAELLPGLIGVDTAPDQNFAVGGADVDDTNAADQLLGLLTGGTVALPGVAEEIDGFVSSGGTFGSDALVVLYAGSNDYLSFPDTNPNSTEADLTAFVGDTVGHLEDDIRSLAAAGAQTLLVPNVVDLGMTPLYRDTNNAATETELAARHNQALNDQLGDLADQLGVEIVVVDFASGFNLILSDPTRFGFTNITDPCVEQAVPSLPPYVAPGSVCTPEEAATSAFFDYVHPTAAGHQLLAEFAADTLTAPTTVGAETGLAAVAGDNFLRRMDDELRQASLAVSGTAMLPVTGERRPYEVFLSAETSQGKGDFDGAALGFDYSIASLAGGITFHASDSVSFGFVGGYDHGDSDLDDWDGSADLNSFRLGAMAGYDGGRLFGAAGLAYGFDDYDLSRQTYVPELTSSADADGGTFGAFADAGYRFEFGRLSFGPLAGLRYTHVHVDAYDESGAPGLDMHVDAQSADDLIGSGGIAAAARLPVGSAWLTPYVQLTLEGDLLGDGETLTTALVTVPDVDRHLEIDPVGGAYGRLSGGLTLDFQPGFTVGLYGETTIGRAGDDEYSLLGRLAARF